MITAYTLNGKSLDIQPLTVADSLPPKTLWLDIFKPDEEEQSWMKQLFVEEAPELDELDDIEASARFYRDKDGLHIHSLFPQRLGKEIDGINVLFTLRNDMVISLREDDLGLMRLLRHYMRQDRLEVEDAPDLLLEIFQLKIEYISDLIEDGYKTLEDTGKEVLQVDDLHRTMSDLMHLEDGNGHVRLALYDTRRALRFLKRSLRRGASDEQRNWIDEMLYDIESLLPHTQFLFDKINFQLEAAMGFTSLEQSKVIKIFSVAAVVFLPPTLIASIYGMNFEIMPELGFEYGYLMSLVMMLMSACGTYYFFKRKGWL
ncbi:magnesium and cobalt transport protein CorA [Zobellella denitrificans]|jgi:magnesium transporter|uniref:Magnesium transport protein CorA n=1 Tax=Zobellella denitrificans TaxID=347534 RepID=A0A231MX57_9GAMM|nr:magnesium/cobalt transporter CorA [Zobellella denitrificans]ATG74315.1 magnesium transporter [Zobellella denitrificans]OXS14748.1 magnesium and cobalt transport protein CorA [Zobellella denitrificans]